MKRRKPFRPLLQIEAELAELQEWRIGHQRRLDSYEDRSAVLQIVRNGIPREISSGDPEYEHIREILAEDAAAIVSNADKKVRRLQKEQRKVSRFLARREKASVRKD